MELHKQIYFQLDSKQIMLEGSLQKYRPQKKPSPYNKEANLILQGIGGGSAVNQGKQLPSQLNSRKASSMQSRQQNIYSTIRKVNEQADFLETVQQEDSIMSNNKRHAITMKEQSSPWRVVPADEEGKRVNTYASRNRNSEQPQFTIKLPSGSGNRNDGLNVPFKTNPYTSRRGTNINNSLMKEEGKHAFSQRNSEMGQIPASSYKKNSQNNPMAMTHGVHFSLGAKTINDQYRKVNESLYSQSHQYSQFGNIMHERLRAPGAADPLDPSKQMIKADMHFGAVDKYSGREETSRTIGFTQKDQESIKKNQRTNSVTINGATSELQENQSPFRNRQTQARISEALRSQTANSRQQNGVSHFGTEDLTHKKLDSLMGDTYLPVLRNFRTTLRAPHPSQQAQVADLKKTKMLEALKPMVPKLINKEKINQQRTNSLFDRQRNILIHAQMQNPIKNKNGKDSTMHKTRNKDWLVDEVERKVKDLETVTQPQTGADGVKDARNRGDSSSEDQYDPLADSDGSSERSETPPRLTGAQIQATIKSEMKEMGNVKLHKTSFWKELIRAEPEGPVDENGAPLPLSPKKELTSFQMIKKMMRLKKKQDAVPEDEKFERFVPKIQPMFSGEGKEQYYFDMQNNAEHYQLLTGHVTQDQFAVYEDREQLRADALFHSRKVMQDLVARKYLEEQRQMDEKQANAQKKIDIDTLGEYKSSMFQHEKTEVFEESSKLQRARIIMDDCAKTENMAAAKIHISKQKNKKNMLCPQKVLRMDEFARDIVNGIIWDEVRSGKVHTKALFKMGVQQMFGARVAKQMHRDLKLDKLEMELGQGEANSPTLKKPKIDHEKDQHLHKDLFQHSQKKQQFFEVAKQMQNTQDIQQSSNAHAISYMRFYQKCQKSGTLALPIFSKAHNQIFSVVGQFISEGMAAAMAEVLRRTYETQEETAKKLLSFNHQKTHIVEEEKVPYIAIKEINLDDNGLKDTAFSYILKALATQPGLKRISYVNNEIGLKSISELVKILGADSEGDLSDLRMTRVKSTKHDLNMLLQALSNSQCSRLTRLRLSHVEIDEYCLMESLKSMVYNVPQIQELNLSNINIHGRQLSDVMEVISENCQQIQYLNLSYNSLPLNKQWLETFLTHLVTMIKESAKLIDINLSGMNFKDSVKEIQWPLSKSKTIQSIHLSDNNIPKAAETNMLMVFGIKSNEGDAEFSIAGKLDQKQLKRNAAMSGFQIKIQQKIDLAKEQSNRGDGKIDIQQHSGGRVQHEEPIIGSYEDATARIANAVEIRDMKQDRNYHQSLMKGGLGRGYSTVQPLVITRKLGHPELIFNEHVDKNTHFKVHASAKWARMQSNECWICDQWKYTVIFFGRKDCDQHYARIIDQERIDQIEEMYDLNQEDQFIVENKEYPLLLGSITKNTVVSMTQVSMFNLFLDEKNIKKSLGGQGERALKAVLQISQGMKNAYKNQISLLNNQDWLTRFKDNLPFPEREILICNLPESGISSKIERGERLTKEEIEERKIESTQDVYCFAGYVEPGKHQIIIKDQETGYYYAREIVIEARNREIINCHQVTEEKNPEAIKRFETMDSMTGQVKEVLDLDNSVFMNFQRYMKQDVANCFEADMRSSDFESVILDDEELQKSAAVFERNYAAYCQVFHEISAQFDHFPLIDLNDLPEILYTIGVYAREKAKPISEKVIAEYKEILLIAAESQVKVLNADDEAKHLNRVKFAEVLLLVIKSDNCDNSDFSFSQELTMMFLNDIIPFLTRKEADQMPISLNAFRDRYVWIEKVNLLFELNLEGIMEVFSMFSEDIGFTIDSATKLLKGIGCLLSHRTVQMQFDLAQMTVIDESVNSDEYSDMEFVEFLEFLVRLAFQIHLDEDKNISIKLADLLKEILPLVNAACVDPPRSIIQSQASDDDMSAFQSYMKKT